MKEREVPESEQLRKKIAELQAREGLQRDQIAELRESGELFRSIYTESPISIELCDANGKIVDVNRACLDMFGMYRVADRKWPSLFEDPLVPEQVKKAIVKNETVRYEVSVDFDRERSSGGYKGTRHGTGVFDVLVSPLGVRVARSSTGYLIEVQEVTDLKQAEGRVSAYQDQLRSLASQLSIAEERERRSLAADLHDQVGQALAIIKLKLGLVRQHVADPDAGPHLDEIRALLDEAISHTRSLTFDLSPPILYELGLEPALEWLAEQFQQKYGIPVQMHDDGQLKPLGDDVRGMLFRAVRELLINVAKHARAQNVALTVNRIEGSISIQVKDDGAGFDGRDSMQPARGFGLFNIRERLTAIGGRLGIESERGHGATITVVAPLTVDDVVSEGTH